MKKTRREKIFYENCRLKFKISKDNPTVGFKMERLGPKGTLETLTCAYIAT